LSSPRHTCTPNLESLLQLVPENHPTRSEDGTTTSRYLTMLIRLLQTDKLSDRLENWWVSCRHPGPLAHQIWSRCCSWFLRTARPAPRMAHDHQVPHDADDPDLYSDEFYTHIHTGTLTHTYTHTHMNTHMHHEHACILNNHI